MDEDVAFHVMFGTCVSVSVQCSTFRFFREVMMLQYWKYHGQFHPWLREPLDNYQMLLFQLDIGPWYPVSEVHDAAAVLGLSRHLSVEYLECCEQMQQVIFNADRSQVRINPLGGHVSEPPSTPPRKSKKNNSVSEPIPVP